MLDCCINLAHPASLYKADMLCFLLQEQLEDFPGPFPHVTGKALSTPLAREALPVNACPSVWQSLRVVNVHVPSMPEV